MPKLVVEKGSDKGKTLDITNPGSYIIGRDNSAHLKLSDSLISRLHIKVESGPSGFTVTDMDSLNGTMVNSEQIKEKKGSVGDIIEIGETTISILDESEGARLDALVGQTIGGYRVIERIGRGGMGTVYKAIQLRLNRIIALKLLSEDLVKDPTFINLFIQEARSAAQLNHPNIIQVYDFNKTGNLCYFSMEFVPYGSVQELLAKEKKLAPERAIKMILDACAGLEYAEKKGIVHRDIKPDNLMVAENDIIKIGDLGLAKSLKDRSQKDQGIFGTPHYIAPEQALGKDVDHKADIYSLGATFYRILTGSTPYSGANVKEIISKKLKEDARPLKTVMPDIPVKLCGIVDKMMKRLPEERYQSSAEIIRDLHDYMKQPEEPKQEAKPAAAAAAPTPASAKTQPKPVTASVPRSRKNLSMILGSAAVALLVILIIIIKLLTQQTVENGNNGSTTPLPPVVDPGGAINPSADPEEDRIVMQLMREAIAKDTAMDINDSHSIYETISAYKRIALEHPDHPETEKALNRARELEPLYDTALARQNAAEELASINERYKNDFESLSEALVKNPDKNSDVQTFYETFYSEFAELAKKYPGTPEAQEALSNCEKLKVWYNDFVKEQGEYLMCFVESNSFLEKDNFGTATEKIRGYLKKFPSGIFSPLANGRIREIETSAFRKFTDDVQVPVGNLIAREDFNGAIELINAKKKTYNFSKLDAKFSEITKSTEKRYAELAREKEKRARENDIRVKMETVLQAVPFERKYNFADAQKTLAAAQNRFQTDETKQWAAFYSEKLRALAEVKELVKQKLKNFSEGQSWRNITYSKRDWVILEAEDTKITLRNPKNASMTVTVSWDSLPVEDIINVLTEKGFLLKKRFNYDDMTKVTYLYFEWGQFIKGQEMLLDLRKKVTDELSANSDPKEQKNLKNTLDRINTAVDFFNTENSYNISLTKILYDAALSEYEGSRNSQKDALERLLFLKNYLNYTEEYQRNQRTIENMIDELQKKLK